MRTDRGEAGAGLANIKYCFHFTNYNNTQRINITLLDMINRAFS